MINPDYVDELTTHLMRVDREHFKADLTDLMQKIYHETAVVSFAIGLFVGFIISIVIEHL